MHAKNIFKQTIREYECAYTSLKESYEQSKLTLFSSIHQKLKEISIFCDQFDQIPKDVLRIVKNESPNLHHRSIVNSIRQEVQVLRERKEQLSTIEKLQGTGD